MPSGSRVEADDDRGDRGVLGHEIAAEQWIIERLPTCPRHAVRVERLFEQRLDLETLGAYAAHHIGR
jgi:hypothetical protein